MVVKYHYELFRSVKLFFKIGSTDLKNLCNGN